jgi:hypothetical protein
MGVCGCAFFAALRAAGVMDAAKVQAVPSGVSLRRSLCSVAGTVFEYEYEYRPPGRTEYEYEEA